MDDEDDNLAKETARLKAKWGAGIGASAERSGIAAFESKWAAGFRRIGGKRIAADGLVSRGGFRRILPDQQDDGDDLKLERVEKVQEIAAELLRGRTATVFENLVVAPLQGQAGATVEALAKQFGVSLDRIYKIKHGGRRKVAEKIAAMQRGASVDGRPPCYEMTTVEEAFEHSKPCGVCGRVFIFNSDCQRISSALPGKMRSECLATQDRSRELYRLIAEAREKDRIWDELYGAAWRARENAKDSARLKAELDEVAAITRTWSID
jgi:hypothetical protein